MRSVSHAALTAPGSLRVTCALLASPTCPGALRGPRSLVPGAETAARHPRAARMGPVLLRGPPGRRAGAARARARRLGRSRRWWRCWRVGFPATAGLAWAFDLTREGSSGRRRPEGRSGRAAQGGPGAALGWRSWRWARRSAPVSPGSPAGSCWGRAPAPGPDGRITVAVADFVERDEGPDLDGLSGLLITSLEQSQRLRVLTRSRMFDVLRQLGRDGVPSGRRGPSVGRWRARRASRARRRLGAAASTTSTRSRCKRSTRRRDEYFFTAAGRGDRARRASSTLRGPPRRADAAEPSGDADAEVGARTDKVAATDHLEPTRPADTTSQGLKLADRSRYRIADGSRTGRRRSRSIRTSPGARLGVPRWRSHPVVALSPIARGNWIQSLQEDADRLPRETVSSCAPSRRSWMETSTRASPCTRGPEAYQAGRQAHPRAAGMGELYLRERRGRGGTSPRRARPGSRSALGAGARRARGRPCHPG